MDIIFLFSNLDLLTVCLNSIGADVLINVWAHFNSRWRGDAIVTCRRVVRAPVRGVTFDPHPAASTSWLFRCSNKLASIQSAWSGRETIRRGRETMRGGPRQWPAMYVHSHLAVDLITSIFLCCLPPSCLYCFNKNISYPQFTVHGRQHWIYWMVFIGTINIVALILIFVLQSLNH